MIGNENSVSEKKTSNNRNVNSENQIVKPKTPIPVKLNNCFDSWIMRWDCNIDTTTNKDVQKDYSKYKTKFPNPKSQTSMKYKSSK